MNISTIITPAIVTMTSVVISNIITWFLAKKKYNSEVDATLISNMQDSLEFYMKLSDDTKTRLEETLKRNDSLEKEIYQLREQVFKLMNSMVDKSIITSKKHKEINNATNGNKKVQKSKLHNRETTC